jgi:hypothetical protein
MLEGLAFELPVPRANLHSVYLAVTGFEGPTLRHLGYYPRKWSRTTSVAGILEVVYVGGRIAVPTLRESDHCYQLTGTPAWCIDKSFYRATSPAFLLDPGGILDQHLGRIWKCHHPGRGYTTPIVRVGFYR